MYKYYNANPKGRHVNDCTIRAISLATGESWNETYLELSDFARYLAIMPDDVVYIDAYLEGRFKEIYKCKTCHQITVGEFVEMHPKGTFLITMSGHITCAIDGVIYDTFNPSDRFVWGVYEI